MRAKLSEDLVARHPDLPQLPPLQQSRTHFQKRVLAETVPEEGRPAGGNRYRIYERPQDRSCGRYKKGG